MTQNSSQQPVEIRLSPDRMTASVAFFAGPEAGAIDAGLVDELARAAGVQINADVQRRIREAVDSFNQEPAAGEFVIAQGTSPTPGVDGRLNWVEACDPTQLERVRSEEAAESDVIDHYNIRRRVVVDEGVHIGTLLAPTEGRDGLDITGKVIPCVPGRAVKVALGPNVIVDDVGKIISRGSGHLRFDEKSLDVVQRLEIDRYVDFETGNISYQGTVHIRQGVRSRFTVRATEDITVDGLVEAATIECGGNFLCGRGMAAKDRGRLMVDGNATLKFLNNVRGRVGDDLVVSNEIINCELVVGRNLDCAQGTISGGKTIVTGALKVGVLGSQAGVETIVLLGTVPMTAARQREVSKRSNELRVQYAKVQEAIEGLKVRGDRIAPCEKERMTELNFDASDLMQQIEECEHQHAAINQEIEQMRMFDLQVGKLLNTGVHLISNDQDIVIRQELRGPLRVFWDERRVLQYQLGDGQVRPLSEVAAVQARAA